MKIKLNLGSRDKIKTTAFKTAVFVYNFYAGISFIYSVRIN